MLLASLVLEYRSLLGEVNPNHAADQFVLSYPDWLKSMVTFVVGMAYAAAQISDWGCQLRAKGDSKNEKKKDICFM